MEICDIISLNSSQNEKYFGQTCRENKKKHVLFSVIFFLPKIMPFMR